MIYLRFSSRLLFSATFSSSTRRWPRSRYSLYPLMDVGFYLERWVLNVIQVDSRRKNIFIQAWKYKIFLRPKKCQNRDLFFTSEFVLGLITSPDDAIYSYSIYCRNCPRLSLDFLISTLDANSSLLRWGILDLASVIREICLDFGIWENVEISWYWTWQSVHFGTLEKDLISFAS